MTKQKKVLLIEDNHAIAKQVVSFLEGHNWNVDYASSGSLGLNLAQQSNFDLIILDLNLPDIDGLQVCEEIKSGAQAHVPVLMLTARDAFEDKHKGFTQGADDYLTKPFDLRELALRCEALSRRLNLHENHMLKCGRLTVDNRSQIVKLDEKVVTLSKVGFSIVQKLAESYPYPVCRSDIIEHIWGDTPPESNALKSHIYTLRKVFEREGEKEIVSTISNIGYQLNGVEN